MTTPEGVSAQATKGRTVETEVKPRTQHLRRENFSKGQIWRVELEFYRNFNAKFR